MRSKLILICVIVAISLGMLACSSTTTPTTPAAPSQVSVEATCDDFAANQHISKEVTVANGGSVTVTLCSNPTTGYNWDSPQIADQTVLEQTDHKVMPAQSSGGPPPPPGAPGEEEWTFKALKDGQTTVSIEYSRPWEGGEKGTWTFELTVVVK